jgi:polyisoprenoid-binding protein YceI
MTTVSQIRETLPTGTWQVDAVHSHVGFAVGIPGGTFRGTFSPVEAELVVDEDGNARLGGSVRVDAVKVQDETLGAHLLSPDFFDAERTPVISFASTDVRRAGTDVAAAGELTIKGRTHEVELDGSIGEPVVDGYGRERFSLTLSTVIDRRQFGVDWSMELPSGEPAVGNDVTLVAELLLIRQD